MTDRFTDDLPPMPPVPGDHRGDARLSGFVWISVDQIKAYARSYARLARGEPDDGFRLSEYQIAQLNRTPTGDAP